MDRDDLKDQITSHWTRRTDTAALERKLAAAPGADRARLFETLAPHDQLHAGLMEATRLLARWADLSVGSRVLDIGAGLGGTARFLAEELNCRVTAVDVTPVLHEAASALTERLGLTDRVEHLRCDIVELPRSEPYDAVLLQHVDMQIRDKDGLYSCARRCCSDKGRVIWHDWLTGAQQKPSYPVMWSEDGALSFLSSPTEFCKGIQSAGLELVSFEEIGDQTKKWFERAAGRLDSFVSKLQSSSVVAQARKKGAESLREEIENTLRNMENRRLIPFFALATVR